jgi:hypothetical protein
MLVRRESGRVRGWECDVMVRRRLDERVQAAQASVARLSEGARAESRGKFCGEKQKTLEREWQSGSKAGKAGG